MLTFACADPNPEQGSDHHKRWCYHSRQARAGPSCRKDGNSNPPLPACAICSFCFFPSSWQFVELSKAQDAEAGDGTTSVVVIAGSLLTAAQNLLERGYHPTLVSEAFLKCSKKAQEIMREMAIPVELNDRESLLKSAVTSLNSKVRCYPLNGPFNAGPNLNFRATLCLHRSCLKMPICWHPSPLMPSSRSLIPRPRPTSISQTSRYPLVRVECFITHENGG